VSRRDIRRKPRTPAPIRASPAGPERRPQLSQSNGAGKADERKLITLRAYTFSAAPKDARSVLRLGAGARASIRAKSRSWLRNFSAEIRR
jgi:hypothetical protein